MSIFAVKQTLSRGIGRCINLDRIIKQSRHRYVMAYHRVLSPEQARADHVHAAMWVTPETMEAQIRWFRSIGDIVDYRRILDFDTPNDRPMFAVTFDDGWRDSYDFAFPILEKYRVPALIFLVTAAMESGELFWPEDVVTKTHRAAEAGFGDKLVAALFELWPANMPVSKAIQAASIAEDWVEALKLIPETERKQRIADYYRCIGVEQTPLQGYLMSWEQVRKMRKAGITFGSHTHTHKILKGLPETEIEAELSQSKEIIADRLQTQVETFCYPNARYSGKEGALLVRYGYRYAFCIDGRVLKHPCDRFYVPRFLVSERVARNHNYFRLHLLEAPMYAGRPHKTKTSN